MSVTILGIGTAMPPHAIAQSEAAELAKAFCCRTEEHARLLPIMYKRTHIRQRGSVLLDAPGGSPLRQSFFPAFGGNGDQGPSTAQRMQRYAAEAIPLALAAARTALTESHVAAEQMTQLITISCTGFMAPGIDVHLIKKLGLAKTVGRTHIGFMGCHAALNGLRVAAAMTEADRAARVLLCVVELCSLHFQYGWDTDAVVTNALFADGAAALVAAPTSLGTSGDAWRVAASGSCLFPDSEEAMTWRIGDHGFEMTLSADMPALLASCVRPWLERWLTQQSLTLRQIQSWAIHPGGPRILSTIGACLDLPDHALAASREVLADYGNMSSPTLLFILQRLRVSRAPRPCVALGFGPGLVVEAALLI